MSAWESETHHEHNGDDDDDREALELLDGGEQLWWSMVHGDGGIGVELCHER